MARVSSSLMHNVSLVSNFNIQYIFSSLSRSLVHINFLYWLLLVCRVLFCATHSLTNNQKESWDSLFTCSVFYSVEWFTLFLPECTQRTWWPWWQGTLLMRFPVYPRYFHFFSMLYMVDGESPAKWL